MICIRANENGSLGINVTFTAEDGVEHEVSALKSARWQLSDKDGNVINNRTFANGLFTSSPVILSGDDLAIGTNGTVRLFAIKVVYDSTFGVDLPATDEIKFVIRDIINI